MKLIDLSTKTISQLNNNQKEAFLNCYQVFQKFQKNSAGTNILKCKLELFREYLIVRYNSEEKKDICLAYDYNVKFQVKRLSSQTQGKIGAPTGITFGYETYDKASSDLKTSQTEENEVMKLEFQGLKNDEASIQNFARALEKRYIVQKGFHSYFKAIRKIGEGGFSYVYSALSFIQNKHVAIKSFKRSVYFESDNGNGKKAFQNEFKILTELDHPNVCKIKGVFETENSTYVAMELLSMSLYIFLQKYGFPKQNIAKKIIRQLLQGIKYIHDKGIMHRDLKLQNIMIKGNDKKDIKPVIIDLGLAQYANSTQYIYNRCGTPGYVAPEILMIKINEKNKTYTTACDMFSLGVIFHILLLQKPVFQGRDPNLVTKKNIECQIDFSGQKFQELNDSGKQFLKKLLEKDPQKRMTVNQALKHQYLTEIKQVQTSNSLIADLIHT